MRRAMEKPPHIYVIGAGVIGLATADALVAGGATVTILEKRAGSAQGASFANSGMIHPSQAWPWLKGDFLKEAQQVLALGQRSKILLQNRMSMLGLLDASRPQGCVQLFDSIIVGEAVLSVHEMLGDACEVVSGAAHTFGRFALKYPEDGSGNAYAYCQALENHLKQSGAAFEYNVSGADIAQFLDGPDPVVIAAGLGSVELCAKLNVELPLYPEQGFALNFKKPDMGLPDMPIMHHASRSAMTVFADHVRLSGTVGAKGPQSLLAVWEEIAPEIVQALGMPTMSWQEDRPMSDLGRPIISHVKDNVWVNAGHGHMGWTLSAGSGELMAEMILEDQRHSVFPLV